MESSPSSAAAPPRTLPTTATEDEVEALVALERAAFDRQYRMWAVRVDRRGTSYALDVLRPYLCALPKVRGVRPLKDPAAAGATAGTPAAAADAVQYNGVLLSEQWCDFEALPEAVLDAVARVPGASVCRLPVRLGYEHLSADQVLRTLLPAPLSESVPSSFEIVGHIAHLNLREEYLPYKRLIAQVLLDKNGPRVRTIVNKCSTIATEYRTFPLEVLAGEPDLEADVYENGCHFRLNLATVYWNSRLSSEHARLVSEFRPGEVIADLFAGVGPFAVPAAKKGCVVYANDLNPQSHHYLVANVQRNHVARSVHTKNLDARAFVRELAARSVRLDHVVMNLPASAELFLDSLASESQDAIGNPRVHCHMFTRDLDAPEADCLRRARAVLGRNPFNVSSVVVRDVAPKKWMVCLAFHLFESPPPPEPEAAALAPVPAPVSSAVETNFRGCGAASGPPAKRPKNGK